MRSSIILFCSLFATCILAQDEAPENWFNLDNSSDKVMGVSTEKTYQSLLKGKNSETIIVAVIDSGVDPDHEDLKDVMWVNMDEIPDNGIDDDKNGYVDDIHGWNFIGGKNGKNVDQDTYEVTRLYAKYKKIFENKDKDSLSKKEKKAYAKYEAYKKEVEEKQEELKQQSTGVMMFAESIKTMKAHLKKDDITLEDVNGIDASDEKLAQAAGMLKRVLENGTSMADLEKEISGAVEYFDNSLKFSYNPDFNPRGIVGDNYNDIYQKGYGNNDVQGPDAGHGTHVAGIIAASRNNKIGIKGVADNVRIMSIRAVPNGDERDKDVANAIIYAVDNGASIINMSFGKGHSWDKTAVDKAVRYAEKKDVLLVHAAGNSSQDNDNTNNFPNDGYKKKGLFRPKMAKNWMEIGALNWKPGEDSPARFSNYGQTKVDVFAPGVQINSTTPDQGYEKFSGTSMAAPVTAGVAAVLRSYFPTLSARQVKEIIMESSAPLNFDVKKPGTKDLVPFSKLSVTGGVVNTFNAVQKAMKTKGKKKIKKSKNVVRP